MYLSTSILSAQEENAVKTFYNLEEAKIDYFHIDVMDGKFVKSNTHKKMLNYCNLIKQISNLPLDIHFMVYDVKKYIDEYLKFEPNIISVHYESFKTDEEVFEIINYIKENNMKPSIVIKPNTPVDKIYKFLPYLYMILIMTVEPGKGGQDLILETLEKIKKLKQYVDDNNFDVYIEADGGINPENVELVKNAGADFIVSGTSIIKSNNYKDIVKKLKSE